MLCNCMSFFDKLFLSNIGLAYFGEYPLAWAASVDDKMMYNLLINNGADPNLQDSFGNTILHVIVTRERLMFYSFALKHPSKPADERIKNRDGYTPLALAALLGRDEIFNEIVELKCFDFWTYSIITCCGYPLNLIDSLQLKRTKEGGLSVESDSGSALNLISNGKSDHHIEMLRSGIVQKLLDEKWKTFGYVKFTRSLMMTLVYLMTLSVVVFLRQAKVAAVKCDDETDLDARQQNPVKFWIRTAAEIITTIACLRLLLNHGMEIKSNGLTKYRQSLKKRVLLVVFTLSNILILGTYIVNAVSEFGNKSWMSKDVKLVLEHVENLMLAIAIPLAWCYLIFFAAGMKLSGPFVSMLRYMMVQDMTQFSVIYLIFIYAFSQG